MNVWNFLINHSSKQLLISIIGLIITNYCTHHCDIKKKAKIEWDLDKIQFKLQVVHFI